MKCLIITPFKQQFGGVESVNLIIEESLSEKGIAVEYLTIDHQCNSVIMFASKILGTPIITRFSYKKIKKNNYDFVICNGEYGFGIEHKKKFVLHHGSYYGYEKQLKNNKSFKQKLSLFRGAILQKLASRKAINIAVSKYVDGWLKQQGISIKYILPNASTIDKLDYRSQERNGKGLFVTSENFYAKGMDVINSLSNHFAIDYVCTSEIPELRANYLGFIPHNLMLKLYSEYSYVILPSRFEGMSMSLIESMSVGTPVLTSLVGGAYEIREIEPRFVVEFLNPEQFRINIDFILNNFEDMQSQAIHIYETEHTEEKYKNRLFKILGLEYDN